MVLGTPTLIPDYPGTASVRVVIDLIVAVTKR
jgi:hypothetical protein